MLRRVHHTEQLRALTWIAHTTLTMSRVVCLHLPGMGSCAGKMWVITSNLEIMYQRTSNVLCKAC